MHISNEVIAYQDKEKYKDIESLVNRLKTDIVGSRIKSLSTIQTSYGDELSDLLKSHFNMDIKVKFTKEPIFMSIQLKPGNRDHTLLSKNIKKQMEEVDEQVKLGQKYREAKRLLDESMNVLGSDGGTVDTKNVTVGGDFAKVRIDMFISPWQLFKTFKFTIREFTAAILHEVGHPFTWFNTIADTSGTNRVLEDAFNSVIKQQDYKSSNFKIDESNDIHKLLSKEQLRELKNTRVLYNVKMYKMIGSNMSSNMSSIKYDETSSEQLADMFSARCGYGRELVSVTSKLDINALGGLGMFMFNAVTVMMPIYYITLIILFPAIVLYMPFILIGYLIIAVFSWMWNGSNNRNMSYDDTKRRIKRILDQTVNRSKDKGLSSKESRKILDDYNYMKGIFDITKDQTTLQQSIWDMLSSKNGTARDDIKLQQMLEDLVNNPLFISSLKLRQNT